MVIQVNEELKKKINYIALNELDKLSNEELRALKQMILFLDNYDNNIEETKTR